MDEPDQGGWRRQALIVVRSATKWACVFLIVAAVLYLIRPAPHGYLLAMMFLGVSYAIFLSLVWQRASTLLFFLLAGYVSASATLAERLFRIDSQYEDVQGVFLAFAFSGIYMTLTRSHFVRVLEASEDQINQEAEQDVDPNA